MKENNQNQLYYLFGKISSNVNHRDYLGSIISYNVISGLLDFSTNIGFSRNDRLLRPADVKNLNRETIKQYKYEEMRSIYKSINTNLETITKEGIDAGMGILIKKCNPPLEKYISNEKKYDKQSLLLFNIVEMLKDNRNFGDTLRKKGIVLFEEVRNRNAFIRPSDYLKEDSESVLEVMTRKRDK